MKTVTTAKTKKPAEPKNLPADAATMKSLVEIFKSLADLSRLRILFLLAEHGEMHVSAICEQLGQSQPAVSHHLTQLKNAELVGYRRDGKFNFYKLDSQLLGTVIESFYPAAATAQQKLTFGELELNFKRKG